VGVKYNKKNAKLTPAAATMGNLSADLGSLSSSIASAELMQVEDVDGEGSDEAGILERIDVAKKAAVAAHAVELEGLRSELEQERKSRAAADAQVIALSAQNNLLKEQSDASRHDVAEAFERGMLKAMERLQKS